MKLPAQAAVAMAAFLSVVIGFAYAIFAVATTYGFLAGMALFVGGAALVAAATVSVVQ